MVYKENDFLEISYDMYADGTLYSSTDKEKAKKENVSYVENKVIILGKKRILKALDDDIIKNYKKGEKVLELKPEDAFGKRRKDLLIKIKENVFKKNNIKPIVGGIYNIDNQIGIVKSVGGGRVLIDFNNPLAGKEIKIIYKVVKKIEDVEEKLKFLLKNILGIDMKNYKYDKQNNTLFIDKFLINFKDDLVKEIENTIEELKGIKIEEKKSGNSKTKRKV